jgi:hypothetical protein
MIKRGIVLVFAFLLLLLNYVSAIDEGYCATAEITSINPSSIGAEEDFTVGIQIDNCGEKIPENITFEITRHSKDIEIKEPLINYIGKLGYSNSKRFILYHMHSSPDASPGKHTFETKLSYGAENFFIEEENNFSITINTENPDLTISGVYTTPEIIYENEKIILVIDVENSGEGDAKDVRIEIEDLNLQGIKQKYLGQIQSDESMPARFVFEENKKGIYNGNIKLNYKFGGEIKEINFPLKIQVFEKESNNILTFSVILILGVLIYFLLKKKINSKN